jgi:hypothetical protein
LGFSPRSISLAFKLTSFLACTDGDEGIDSSSMAQLVQADILVDFRDFVRSLAIARPDYSGGDTGPVPGQLLFLFLLFADRLLATDGSSIDLSQMSSETSKQSRSSISRSVFTDWRASRRKPEPDSSSTLSPSATSILQSQSPSLNESEDTDITGGTDTTTDVIGYHLSSPATMKTDKSTQNSVTLDSSSLSAPTNTDQSDTYSLAISEEGLTNLIRYMCLAPLLDWTRCRKIWQTLSPSSLTEGIETQRSMSSDGMQMGLSGGVMIEEKDRRIGQEWSMHADTRAAEIMHALSTKLTITHSTNDRTSLSPEATTEGTRNGTVSRPFPLSFISLIKLLRSLQNNSSVTSNDILNETETIPLFPSSPPATYSTDIESLFSPSLLKQALAPFSLLPSPRDVSNYSIILI